MAYGFQKYKTCNYRSCLIAMAQIKIITEKALSDNTFPLKLYEFEKLSLTGKRTSKKTKFIFDLMA